MTHTDRHPRRLVAGTLSIVFKQSVLDYKKHRELGRASAMADDAKYLYIRLSRTDKGWKFVKTD